MPDQRFYSFKEKLLLFILFISAIFSLIFFLKFHTLAFPEHNIKLEITRNQAARKASEFLRAQGININDYKQSTIFYIDDQAKTYLERETGVGETAKLALNQIDLWSFNTRFFKPLQKEEFTVSFLPNGRFAGYQRIVDEAMPGASLNTQQAQLVAQQFLAQKLHLDTTKWQLVSEDMMQKIHRMDHLLVWEEKGFKAKQASYRIQVIVQGNQVGGYNESLKIPDDWTRQFDKESSNNSIAQVIAEAVMYILFGLSMIIFYILKFRQNDLRLKFCWWVAGIAFIISLLEYLNSIPLLIYDYPTTSSWGSFIGQQIMLGILESIAEGLMVLFILAVGEALYREVFPKKISLEYTFTKGLFSKPVNKGILIGTFTALILFSYEIAYYLLGKKIGIWTPADVNYSDAYSTLLPWTYPFLVGFTAAVTEEGIFRFFGISFLKRYLKKTWLAVLITSVSWAFLHSNYPQSPWFARGIEITITGLVFGFIFVRYGIIASVVAHYTYDALQTALSFTSSHNDYIIISSLIISFLPGILGLFVLIKSRKKGFVSIHQNAINESLKITSQSSAGRKVPDQLVQKENYIPLPSKMAVALLLSALAGIIAIQILTPEITIKSLPASITRQKAVQIAQAYLLTQDINFQQYQYSVNYTGSAVDVQAIDYILENSNFAAVKRIYPGKIPTNYWSIRFFRPLQKEEFDVSILPNGNIYQITHILDEKAPGANLSGSQALIIAKNYLTQTKKYNMNNYRLVDSSQDKKQNRTDYTFTFEEKTTKIALATFRTEVDISGNSPTNFNQFIKIPDDWIREKDKTTLKDFATEALIGISGIIVLFLVLITFLKNVRNKRIQFRSAFLISSLSLIIVMLSWFNSLPAFYNDYSTEIPIGFYEIESIIMMILGALIDFLIFAVLIGLFIALWKQYVGKIIPGEPHLRSKFFKDSLIVGYTVPVIEAAVSVLIYNFFRVFNIPFQPNLSETSIGLDHFFPFFAVLSEIPTSVSILLIIMIIFLALYAYLKKQRNILLFISILIILIAIPQKNSVIEFVVGLVQYLFLFIQIYILVFYIAVKNFFAYLNIVYVNLLIFSSLAFLNQPENFLKLNGIVLLFFTLLPLLLYIVYEIRRKKIISY